MDESKLSAIASDVDKQTKDSVYKKFVQCI